MKFNSIALGVLLAAGAVTAHAADYVFAMPLAPQLPFGTTTSVVGPSFTDTWSFTTPANTASVSGSAISVDITPFFNIDNIEIDLYMGTVGSGSWVSSGTSGESSKLQDIPAIANAAYYFQVSGDVVGAPSGFYAFTAVAAPVPEPETYAMMLAGLGAIGFMASRRRRQG